MTQITKKPQTKRVKRNISGWLVFNKTYDMGSTEAVGKLRWLLEAKKAGHAGTLDPLATGILPIAYGEATKTIPYIQNSTKTYHFTLIWGQATSTDDKEGEIIASSNIRPTEQQVLALLPNFTGKIIQVPPIFSAIKIKGERAYDLARAGEKIVMQPREIEVESFILLEHGEEQSSFEVICAKGTYIRALARDLANELGTKGHVGALHRVSVGHFSDESAIDLEQFENASLEQREAMLKPVAYGLNSLPEIKIDARQAISIRLGNGVLLTGANAPIRLDEAWVSHKGQAVAIGYVEKGQFKPKRVILA